MTEQKKLFSQEVLKIIACITMLIDHIGMIIFPEIIILRVVGRIAFPIFCFLLVEGVYYTKHPIKYGIRLFIGVLLAELPFDLAIYGHWTWEYQSVMVTLLLAYIMIQIMIQIKFIYGKIIVIFPFMLIAELLCTDYGAFGICLIALFMLTRENQYKIAIQAFFICLLSILFYGCYSIEPLSIMALLPIALYSSKKITHNKVLQWTFYLFYPVHLTLLVLIVHFIQ